MSLFDKNLNVFKSLKPTYTNPRVGYLGRYNADGTIDSDPQSGLAPEFVWVRFSENRGATRIKNLKVRAAWGTPVWVEFNELTREDEVREVHSVLAPEVLGGEIAAAVNTPAVPASVSTPVSATDIQPLSVRPDSASGGLAVRVLAGWVHGVWHDGNELLTLVPTATSGKAAFVCVGIEADGDLVQTLTTNRDPAFSFYAGGKLTTLGGADIQAVMDAAPTTFWLWAFLLTNGATTIDLAKQQDLRLWQNAGAANALSVDDGGTPVTNVTSITFTSGATVTDAGGGVAEVAVTGGGSSLTSHMDQLGSDVTVASSAWSDLLSRSLGAGTWWVQASACGVDSTFVSHFICRLYDGTTTHVSGQATTSGGTYAAQVAISAIITLASTTTIKLQGSTTTGGTTSTFKAATPNVGSGNTATTMICIQIA